MASEQEIIRVGKELDKVVQQDPLVSVSRFLFYYSQCVSIVMLTVVLISVYCLLSYNNVIMQYFLFNAHPLKYQNEEKALDLLRALQSLPMNLDLLQVITYTHYNVCNVVSVVVEVSYWNVN